MTTQTPRILVLSVGGLRLVLDTSALPPEQLGGLLSDYAPFLLPPLACGGAQAANLNVHLTVELAAAAGRGFLEPEPGHLWRIDTCRQRGRLIYRSYHEQGWLDLSAQRGRLLLCPGAQPENFLRVAFAQLALAHGGLLLHASGRHPRPSRLRLLWPFRRRQEYGGRLCAPRKHAAQRRSRAAAAA